MGLVITFIISAFIKKRKKGPDSIKNNRFFRRQAKKMRNRRYGIRIRIIKFIIKFSVIYRDYFIK